MKKSIKRITAVVAATMLIASSFTACGSEPEPAEEGAGTEAGAEATPAGETIMVDFWSAPQVVQFNYWSQKAVEFNAAGIKVGDKVVQVNVQQMPEAPSSEAGLQNALATDSAPAVSENVSRGFATVLAESEAVYDLKAEPWFTEVITARGMEESIESWAVNGGQYVLPVYVNPMVYQWNMNGLRALGFTEPPTTIDELKEVITAFRENKDTVMKDMGITSTFYRPTMIRADSWWDRSFDFQMQYSAFTGGKGWVENNELVLDKAATKEVFEFFGLFGDTMNFSQSSELWIAEQVPYLVSISAPWEIPMYREANKVYGLEGDYVYGSPIVKAEGDAPYCFGDSKGLVFYKDANITDEMHQGAVAFVSWVYNAENSTKTDLEWLSATGMLPARGDLLENPEFTAVLAENPELEALATYVPYAVPAMASADMAEIQGVFTETGLAPYMQVAIESTDFNVPDATPYVDAAFTAMEEVMAK